MLLGSQSPDGRQAVKLIADEEAGVHNGATILVDGTRVTKGGAAFANSEMAFAGGKWDTFRMLTHPGTSIIPGALVAAEDAGASGREFITGLAAGYEVMERMAADFIPTVMARGFHAGPVFGIFGAAVAAAKILRFTEDQMNSTIALCASLAAGNLEGARSGGRALREGAAVRNAMLAVALASRGHVGGETVLEGDAGFYHAYAGNNTGRLTYSFVGDTQTSLDKITAELGKDWMFLETLYRIYSTAGYNIAHIDVTAQLCEEHDIRHAGRRSRRGRGELAGDAVPEPGVPEPARRPGVAAGQHRVLHRLRRRRARLPRAARPAESTGGADDPPEVLELMKRVTIIPSHPMTLFGPRITIYTKDGKSYTQQATGREFIWDFDEEARRIRGVVPGLPIPAAQFESHHRDLPRPRPTTAADALVAADARKGVDFACRQEGAPP